MADNVDNITRSRMMARIKSKNTKPELLIRSLLHKKGFRFRLHDKKLAGKPDIVLPKYNAIIFVNGCFWHGHENCTFFRIPGTRENFWKEKIYKNQNNDNKNIKILLKENWRIAIVWECSIRNKKNNYIHVINLLAEWLINSEHFLEISANTIKIIHDSSQNINS